MARPVPNRLPVVPEAREPTRGDARRNRARVVDAAARLFQRDGVQSVSMDAVAREAGVGKGTVFRAFGDRAGLARALLDARERDFQDAFLTGPPPLGPGAPPDLRVLAFGDALIDLLESHGELLAASESGSIGARFRTNVYAMYHLHLRVLVEQANATLDAWYLADALLAPLSAEHYLHQRQEAAMPVSRIKGGWRSLAVRLVRDPR